MSWGCAWVAIYAHRLPTVTGVGFVVLEDETGWAPLELPPTLAADLRRILRDALPHRHR